MLPTAELSSSRVGECASLASQEDAFLASQLGAGAPWEVTVRPGSGPDVVTYDVSPQDPAAEARMKVACITEQVLTLVNKRLGLYRHFDETVNKYKQSRDVSTLNSGKKSLETEHKALTSGLALLQSRLKTEGSDLCDKVSACCRRAPSSRLPRPMQPMVWDTPTRRQLVGRALPSCFRVACAPLGV